MPFMRQRVSAVRVRSAETLVPPVTSASPVKSAFLRPPSVLPPVELPLSPASITVSSDELHATRGANEAEARQSTLKSRLRRIGELLWVRATSLASESAASPRGDVFVSR